MNQLVLLESANPVELFNSNNLDQILGKIAEEARAFPRDMSTEKGRKEIASLAYKISRSKTFLDDLGKKLGEEAQAKINAINTDRRKAREFLDSLKDEIRKPLTDWETAEKNRIRAHESELSRIAELGRSVSTQWQTLGSEAILSRINEIESLNRDWQEFAGKAGDVISATLESMCSAYDRAVEYQKQQEELARLRAAEAERLQREREERIAAEAAEKARREAEFTAKREAEKAEIEAKRERERILAEKREAEERAARALREKAEAEERAKLEQQRAVEAERKRIEQEKLRAEAEEKARENNRKHREKINGEVIGGLVALGLDESMARKVLSAAAESTIPHLKVIY